MKKKALACILAAVMLSGIFGGCGSKPADKTLKVFYWDDLETSTDLTTQQFKAAVDKFNEADNGYQIEMTTSDIVISATTISS